MKVYIYSNQESNYGSDLRIFLMSDSKLTKENNGKLKIDEITFLKKGDHYESETYSRNQVSDYLLFLTDQSKDRFVKNKCAVRRTDFRNFIKNSPMFGNLDPEIKVVYLTKRALKMPHITKLAYANYMKKMNK